MNTQSTSNTLEALRAALDQNLKRLRSDRGLSQERLALESNVDRTYVSKIERGIGNPSLEVLVRLASRLEVKVFDLFQ
jgi:transcriptional regulator with XRE-family HTH domain